MADLRNLQSRMGAGAGTRTGADVDQGLRSYMLRVYNIMALGLALTGFAALGTLMVTVSDQPTQYAIHGGLYLTQAGAVLYGSPLRWVVMFAPLAMVFWLGFRIQNMSVTKAQTVFGVYAALMGLSLSSIFLVFTGESIVQTFFISATAFGALSLYGYSTKRDLSPVGSFLIMGVFGLFIAMIVNIFLQSSALAFAISAIGVVIFAGLTAYDTQQIKEMYYEGDSDTVAGHKAVMGALRLYLDFINLFMFMLQLLGNRR
ncbi:Bax inhibitor-1/YccA family protein [Pararhizobium mangrovi]|uniref:Bax inhibitor-1/YccA family protein n=1 Tax=Pararhizobium mangrovi TaxID=2590452 RepID=A0A506TY41_9HYPH|nr:Bax inhibitor-1/YccA family protein [Pararhizobium mangrovi]TPW27003.1 Bax inhibitor-1/YccA family protein [Pararhizobium mangrovi]